MEEFNLIERQEDRPRFTQPPSATGPDLGPATRVDTVTGSVGPTTALTTQRQSSFAVTEAPATATIDPNAQNTVVSPIADTSTGSTTPSSVSDQPAATQVSDETLAQPASDNHGKAMSNGGIAAAVVVPCLVLALLAAVLLLLRRRRQRRAVTAAQFVHNMQQRDVPHQYDNAAAHNSAYYTGIDTSSDRGSIREHGQIFAVPPPPYVKATRSQPPVLPLVVAGAADEDTRSSTSWTTAPHEHDVEGYLSAGRQDASRRSISSTAYSDNASLHSARAARMSLGSAQMISTVAAQSNDPFHDPASPVSSVDGDETRALHGQGNSRSVSPISFTSRSRA